MATVFIQKRKRKKRNSYLLYYKDPTTLKLKYLRTYQKQKDANQAAHDLRALIDTGRTPEIQKNKAKLKLMTFEEVAFSLKEEWRRRLKRNDLKQKTYEEYVYRLNVLEQAFSKRLLCEISKDDIIDYQEEIYSKLTAVTSNRSLFIIKQVFKHGLKIKATIEDPSQKISYLNEKEQERNQFLLPSELRSLIAAAQKTRAKFYMPTLIYLGAEHGASKQEALSLRWKDINFDYEGIGFIRLFRTKNGRERTEYLMPRTRQALLELQKHQKWMRHRKKISQPESDLVFCKLKGKPLKRFDKAWRATCKIVGLKNFHFHDLRHTFCSNLLLAGSNLKDVKEMIGHRDMSMTDRYSHLTPDHKLIQQNRLTEHYTNGG